MIRKELPAQAANIKRAVGSSSTCTPATADSLRAFLLPTKSVPSQGKPSSDISRCLKPMPLKAQGTREGIKRKKKPGVGGLDISTDGAVILHVQEKWNLATEIVNIILRTLTDTIKNAPAKKADYGKASTKSISYSSCSPRNSEKETPLPLQPLSVNRFSNSLEDPRRPRRSSSLTASNQKEGLRAQAECARIAFAALRSMQLHDGLGQDMPLLQLETGMSALIGKLIAVGFDDLATKELRILKRRLDRSVWVSAAKEESDLVFLKKNETDDAPSLSKEPLESLLSFNKPIDSGPLLPLVITSQLQALRLISTLGNSKTIDASLKYLQLCYPGSPANLIEAQAESALPESIIKVARQLESLSQLLSALCSSSLALPDGSNVGSCKRLSPATVFGLRTAVLEIRLRRWKLLAHGNDLAKDIAEPFGLHISSFYRQSNQTPQEKYLLCKRAYQRLFTSAETIAPSPREQIWLTTYHMLADLAHESNLPEEALQWLHHALRSFTEKQIGSSRHCATSCRIANLRLGALIGTSNRDELSISLSDACQTLKGDLRGGPADFDDLLSIIIILRRSTFAVLHEHQKSRSKTEQMIKSDVIDHASELILLSLKFLVRYVSSISRNENPVSRFNQQMRAAWNNSPAFLESVAAMTRYSVATQMHNWEELELGLRDCTRLANALTDLQSNGTLSSLSQDLKELSYIPISNAYWCRHLYLKQIGGAARETKKSLNTAVDLLRSRPVPEKLNGLLPAKLEKFGLCLEASKEYAKATDIYAEALQLLLQGNVLELAVLACANRPLAEVLGELSEFSVLGRLLNAYIRATSRMDIQIVEARPCFDITNLPPSGRGLLLEQQLIAVSSLIHKQGLSQTIRLMLQEISTSLLDVYNNMEFPIRRLRVILLLLQLRSSHPTGFDITEQIRERQLQGTNMASLESDSGLHNFGAHLLQCRDVYIALLQTTVNLQVVEETLTSWLTVLQESATWDSLRNQVNDIAHWILQLEFLAEYLEVQGFDFLRVRTLQLIVTTHEVREPVEPSAVLTSVSMLASLYTRLGYAAEAGNALQKTMKYTESGAPSDSMVRFNLAVAELAISCGNAAKAEEHLIKAHKTFKRTSEANGSTPRDSYETIQLLSDMNYIYSLLSTEKGQYSKAFLYARVYVKLSYRAWTTIELRQSKNSSLRILGDEASESDVDDLANQMSTLLLAKPIKPPIVSPKLPTLQSPAFWSTVRRLFHALMHLSQLFAHWGLFPEARYYMEQGLKTVEAAQAPCLKSQALGLLGDYLARNGDDEKGIDLLKQAEKLRHGLHVDPFTVSLHVFKANYFTYTKDNKSASEAFDHAISLLDQLVSNSIVKESTVESNAEHDLNSEMSQLSVHERPSTQRLQSKKRLASKKGRSKPIGGVSATTFRRDAQSSPCISILSRLKGTVLRQQASMATSMDKFELAASLLCEAANIPGTPQDLMFNNVGAGQLQLRQAIEAMAADPVFCILPESTTSQPSISAARVRQGNSAPERSPKKRTLASPPRRTTNKGASKGTRTEHAAQPNHFAELLGQAHENILSIYEPAKTACSTATIHSLTDLLTKTLVMLSASTASQAKGAANSLFALYVMEMGKTLSMTRANLAVQVEQQISAHRHLLDWPTRDVEDDIISASDNPVDFSAFQSQYIDIIPHSWTVLSVSLSESQDEIRVARVRSGQSPFILTLPLKRHNFRDPEEECFGFKVARDELHEIVNLANFSAHDAQDMARKGARSEWWEVRAALDARLQELLCTIENVWLGGFRGIFSQTSHNPELLSRFQQSLHNILNKHLPSRQKQGRAKASGRITLDSRVLELFVGLGIPTEQNDLDELLMDLLYFVVDILQFHGEHNAYDEIDFDSISVEIIDALRHYHKAVEDEFLDNKSCHTILILDKALHAFPWESLPCLRERAVSRLPSLACLRDRILQQKEQREKKEQKRGSDDGLHVDRSCGAAILNPAADLTATQAIFEQPLQRLRDWEIVLRREPSEEEMKSCLETHGVFLYFGHGSGAQYIRSRTIKRLDKCAVTLLMGCSSGVLSEAGEFEPYGTPINYMQAGCPALVANLWDVTDKDIDKFSFGALKAWGLFQDDEILPPTTRSPVKGSTNTRPTRGRNKTAAAAVAAADSSTVTAAERENDAVTLDQAVAKSRDLCKLRYLNGAAPVVYGIPVFLA